MSSLLYNTQKGVSLSKGGEVMEHNIPYEGNLPERERRHITQEGIERLNKVREQIRKKHPQTVFTDSAEIVRQMREERSQYLAEL
jgi:hypothetical protein